ncbi:DUF4422 domain-containing protein [Bdellovibrio sp. HCB185ZH]|uniref:DUF4422 domain-containing protein n=1 Tax=Bdellovibrio sp. HCB185ZH TaxID=3394235 RepID=UPI0039A679F5
MKASVAIYVCHHAPGPSYSSEVFKPIHVGKSLSKVNLDAIGDDSGDNISQKNRNYCELTAEYWVWKNQNPKTDYIGLAHYRRFFNFSAKNNSGGIEDFTQFDPETISKFGWSDANVADRCASVDMVIPRLQVNVYFRTNYAAYSHYHSKQDMDLLVGIVREITPNFEDAIQKVMKRRSGRFCNMFVFKRAYFEEFMDWQFKVLSELEKRTTVNQEDSYQRRIFGFAAERLLDIYVEHVMKRDNPKVLELPFVFGVFKPQPFMTKLKRVIFPFLMN